MKKIFISLFMIFQFSSCNWINLEPETMVTYTNFFKTESDAQALVLSSFVSTCNNFTPTNQTLHSTIGALVDELGWTHPFFGNPKLQRSLAPSAVNDEKTDQWSSFYTQINAASIIIDEEARFVESKQISRERLDFYIQQANFIKAIGYFHLAKAWGDVPIMPSHRWVDKLPRAPKEDVLKEAIRCAEIALELPTFDKIVDSQGATVRSKMWGSKGAAAALLADIYAWQGALLNDKAATEKAIMYCTNIIEGKYGSYPCAGSPEAVCNEVLSARQSASSIWEIDFYHTDVPFNRNTNNIYPSSMGYIGYPWNLSKTAKDKMPFAIYAKTVNSFYESDDLRRVAYFHNIDDAVSDPTSENTRPAYINKFRKTYSKPTQYNPIGYINLDVNRVMYRAEGIYLLRAECRNRTGDTGGAISDLNTIRGYANAKLYPNGNMDGKTLAYSILKEWDKEFIFERERYYDVVRNGMWDTEMNPDFPALSASDVKNGALYLPMAKHAISGGNDLLKQTPFWNGRR